MKASFPFDYIDESYFGQIYRPVVHASFKSFISKEWIDVWMVVDSGADFTIFPRHIAELLEVSLEQDCKKDKSVGVGGQEVIFLCKKKLETKVGRLKRNVPIAFLDSNQVPPLMGRLGFLETFDTTFLKTHTVVFEE